MCAAPDLADRAPIASAATSCPAPPPDAAVAPADAVQISSVLGAASVKTVPPIIHHRALGSVSFNPRGPAFRPLLEAPSVPLVPPGPRWFVPCSLPLVLITLFVGIDAAVLALLQSGIQLLSHAAWVPDDQAEAAWKARFPESRCFRSPFIDDKTSPLIVARALMASAGTPVPQLLILANPPPPGTNVNESGAAIPSRIDASFSMTLTIVNGLRAEFPHAHFLMASPVLRPEWVDAIKKVLNSTPITLDSADCSLVSGKRMWWASWPLEVEPLEGRSGLSRVHNEMGPVAPAHEMPGPGLLHHDIRNGDKTLDKFHAPRGGGRRQMVRRCSPGESSVRAHFSVG